jgi:hypothetical protein
MTNEELLEELLIECYKKGIIEEVRVEAQQRMQNRTYHCSLDAYQEAYEKIIEKNSKNC